MQLQVRVMNKLVPSEIHQNLWTTCMSENWYFGHASVDGELDSIPFWKMDLNQNDTADALWNHIKPQCESFVGQPLTVVRQYANGHTYGLGGHAHVDDTVAGTYTLLYYPMIDWQNEWGGETLFFNDQGEISGAVRPVPNRGIFFDSRIAHLGRAPERCFAGLRVTVAYKLTIEGATESS